MGRHFAARVMGITMLFLSAVILTPGIAAAAGLTDADYRYLETEFGLKKSSFALTNISAEDAAELHEMINGPMAKLNPAGRIYNVADVLFDIEMRTCQAWQLAHAMRPCPQVTDERLIPGWNIAERQCNACHLTGTAVAPSFFKMAQARSVDEKELTDALHGTHQMSPITLTPQELRNLAVYINSLRR